MKPATALIGWGQVRHTRHRPAHHAFVYPTAFLMLPMRCLQAGQGAQDLAINRRAWFAFHDADHGDGRSVEQGGALAWLDELLQHEGIHDATGEVWLQAFPRVLGHAFKPVSFWYAHRTDGSLAAIVAEVNNTFGERHCYLLAARNTAWSNAPTRCFMCRRFATCKATTAFASGARRITPSPAWTTTTHKDR